MTRPVLAASILAACERWGPRPALTHRGHTLTYRELGQRTAALAGAYQSLGIRPGDRVVCQMPTCPEHLIAAAATWACGAVHVGADKDLTGPELVRLVDRTGARAVVYQPPPDLAEPQTTLRMVRDTRPAPVVIVHGHRPDGDAHPLADLMADPPSDPPPSPERGQDTALLLATSGTTGRPKLVRETLPALSAKMAFFAEAMSCGPADVHLACLPLAHVFGLKLSLMALTTGGRVVLQDRFSATDALRLVGEEQVTVLPGTPTHLTLVVDAFDPDRHRSDSLRWAVTAAAPLPTGLVDALSERLGVRLLYVYGCSEGFLTRTTDTGEIRRGSVGQTVFRGGEQAPPDGSVRILHPDTDEPVPPGEIGEIAFGTKTPVRYWDQPPEATDGWYRTGDLGRLDEQGRLFVCGRLTEVVNRGGLKVAPREIEAALNRHPQVADCAIIPTPDAVLGEAICACVVPAGRQVPTLTAVRGFLRRELARHKLPDELCALEAVPRSPIGKVNRPALTASVVDDDLPREKLRPARRAATKPGGHRRTDAETTRP